MQEYNCKVNGLLSSIKKKGMEEHVQGFDIRDNIDLDDIEKAKQLLIKVEELQTHGKYIEAKQLMNDYLGLVIEGTTAEDAREIMSVYNFFDEQDVADELGVIRELVPDAPVVPFSHQELENAEKQGYYLIYRTPQLVDGTDITANFVIKNKKIEVIGENNFSEFKLHEINKDHDLYHILREETVKPGWALVKKEGLSDFIHLNYFEQSVKLGDAVQLICQKNDQNILNDIYSQIDSYKMTFRTAIQTNNHNELRSDDIKKINRILTSVLKINSEFRRSVCETIYDTQISGYEPDYNSDDHSIADWTNTISKDETSIWGVRFVNNEINLFLHDFYKEWTQVGVYPCIRHGQHSKEE